MNQAAKIGVAILTKAILLIALFCVSQLEAQRRSTSVNVNSNGKTTISIKNGFGNNFSIEYKGDITLSDDDTDVVDISRGGYMDIKKSAFGNRRRIFMEPDNNGQLIKKYYVGGSQRSFDTEGSKWLAEILLEVVRSTTLGSEKRVNRMYKKGGYYPVLKEVDQITSDYVQTRYLKLLLEKNLGEKGLVATLKRVGDIDSDHHKASILKSNTKSFLSTPATTTAYIRAASKIDSDHHSATVLIPALNETSISDTQMNALLEIVRDIDSDHHKANVLIKSLENRSLQPESIKLIITTTGTIDSDHHTASVLKTVLSGTNLSTSEEQTVLATIENMDSDHHIASVLVEMLKSPLDSESLSRLLERLSREMSSDSHRSTVLRKAIERQDVGKALDAFLEALTKLDSDHHKAEVFRKLSEEDFDNTQLIAILKATNSINSDHHLSASLMSFAPAVSGAPQSVKDAYLEATAAISSDYHLGRAVRAIR